MANRKVIVAIPEEEREQRRRLGERVPSTHRVLYFNVPSRVQRIKPEDRTEADEARKRNRD